MLPETAFGKIVLVVAIAAFYNSVQSFVPSMNLAKRIYSKKPAEVTAFASRYMGLWTLNSGIIRFYAAYNLDNPINLGKIDVIVGLDARGFLLGPTIALRLGCAFVPVRKAGKLPGEVVQVSYTKEYGNSKRQCNNNQTDLFEMQRGAIKPGQRVIILDDLIATGGSAKGAGELVKKSGGTTVQYVFFIELTFFKGRDALDAPTYSVMAFDD
ncbi:adenine phosphoribosyltransferase [Entophlyctis luteolus]|nr:adenine phosphoribosyltransferase [Entophlyctis luteolus]